MTDEEHEVLAPIMVDTKDVPDDEEPTPDHVRSHEMWVSVALVFGFNELAKQAKTLEAKAYCRLARSKAEECAKAYGVEKLIGDAKVVLEVPAGSGLSVTFIESDIELMRDAVAKWDREKQGENLLAAWQSRHGRPTTVAARSELKVGDRVRMRVERPYVRGSYYIIAFVGSAAWLHEDPRAKLEECRKMVHVEDLVVDP